MSEDFFANTLVLGSILDNCLLDNKLSNTDRLLSINTSLMKFLRLALPNSSTLLISELQGEIIFDLRLVMSLKPTNGFPD